MLREVPDRPAVLREFPDCQAREVLREVPDCQAREVPTTTECRPGTPRRCAERVAGTVISSHRSWDLVIHIPNGSVAAELAVCEVCHRGCRHSSPILSADGTSFLGIKTGNVHLFFCTL